MSPEQQQQAINTQKTLKNKLSESSKSDKDDVAAVVANKIRPNSPH